MNFFTPLETIAVISTLLCVYLTVRQSVWCWPVGIAGCVAFGIFFWQSSLYALAALQIFFLISSFHGWYLWLHGGNERTGLRVSRLDRRFFGAVVIASVACVMFFGWVMQRYTNSAVPYWDAAASGLSVVSQVLMMRKKMECWPGWMVVNLLSAGIGVHQGAYQWAALSILLLALDVSGLIEWKKSLATASSTA